MAWTIEYTDEAKSQLSKLDKTIAQRIVAYMRDRVAPLDDPRMRGNVLKGNFGGLWSYRIADDYRVICALQEDCFRILVERIGHRSSVYRYEKSFRQVL